MVKMFFHKISLFQCITASNAFDTSKSYSSPRSRQCVVSACASVRFCPCRCWWPRIPSLPPPAATARTPPVGSSCRVLDLPLLTKENNKSQFRLIWIFQNVILLHYLKIPDFISLQERPVSVYFHWSQKKKYMCHLLVCKLLNFVFLSHLYACIVQLTKTIMNAPKNTGMTLRAHKILLNTRSHLPTN